jgi:hypothetical protein
VFAVVVWIATASVAAVRSERAEPSQEREKARS